jgi:hypothetical protein
MDRSVNIDSTLSPDLGFQVHQDIPDDVWRAYEELLSMGYDKHLVK